MVNIIAGFAIGFVLGLLGGGGSILTVPALVYLSGQTPQAAVTASLAIVGANSLAGAYFHRRAGAQQGQRGDLRRPLLFALAGMLAAYLASGWSRHFPPEALMLAFAGLMLVVGAWMVLGIGAPQESSGSPAIHGSPTHGSPTARPFWLALAAGAGVGLVTGLLGVGGGFLIVPALVILVGLPVKDAVAASLLVIAANSAAGLLGHLGEAQASFSLLGVFLVSGLAGAYGGTRLSLRLPAEKLRRLFGALVIVLGVALLIDQWAKL